MTVFVAPIRGASGRLLACPMTAETRDELQAMCARLELPARLWPKLNPGRNGYSADLYEGQRVRAVNAGAVEIPIVQFTQIVHAQRRLKRFCSRPEAQAFYAEWRAGLNGKRRRRAA